MSTVYTLPPSVPTNVIATATSPVQIVVNWTASTDPQGISSYQILRGTSPASLTQVGIVAGATTAFTDRGLTASTTYYYAITATQASYVSDMSAVASVATLDLPSAPGSIVAAAVTTAQVTVSWAPGPSGLVVSSYRIYRGTSPSSMAQIAVRTTTSFTDTSLTPGTTYYYAIQETDTSANASPMSVTASATTLAPPSAPLGVTATGTTTAQVAVSWSAGPSGMSISSYQIYRGSDPSSLVKLGSRATTSFTDTSLTPGTTYYYAVTETDAAGNVSPMSAVVTATTLAPPSAPTGVTVVANSNKRTTVNWSAGPSGMTIGSYQIYRGTTPTSLAVVATRATTTYTDTTVTPNTTYYYAITETDTMGNVSPASAPVAVTTPN
jgi:fibronectin type 3 domain-containing protein